MRKLLLLLAAFPLALSVGGGSAALASPAYSEMPSCTANTAIEAEYTSEKPTGEASPAADEVELANTAPSFTDVPASHPTYADIMWLAERDITIGWSDGTFRPNQAVSREAMAAFLYRYAGSPQWQPPASSPFSDVPVNHPFYHEISWAAAAGVTTGYPDGRFVPSQSVTRAATAAFLWRIAGNPTSTSGNPFRDVSACVAQRDAILWLAAARITAGYSDGTFRGETSLTRSDLAVFLHRYDTQGYGVHVSPTAPATDSSRRAPTFRDVTSSNPFAADISWLASTGITTGYTDGTFRPSGAVTRDAFVTFLYRMAGSPNYTPPASSPFIDVSRSHPFYKEISWAASKGIAKGYGDGTFRPTQAIQRAAIATFLWRYAGEPIYRWGVTFKDSEKNQHWKAIGWLGETGISTGYADGTFHPNANVERQAIAAFLHRFANQGYCGEPRPIADVHQLACTFGGEYAVRFPNTLPAGMSVAQCIARNQAGQQYGRRPYVPYAKYPGFHYGKDFGRECGVEHGAATYAAVSGRVTRATRSEGRLGIEAIVDGRKVWVRYSHMDTMTVNVGDIVHAGQKIGTVGQRNLPPGPGRSHTHFEVWYGDMEPPWEHTGDATGDGSVNAAQWLVSHVGKSAGAVRNCG